jgi:glycosyltransferase involved in cell wall biosynthesis
MTPKISVVIPAYNSEKCIRETLESVLNQTLSPHEIIIVDDGSKDDTATLIKSFGDRVRYIRQDNQGIAAARNTGIQSATGDWIAFLDHDDLWLPTKLEKQSKVATENPDLICVYTTFAYLHVDGSLVEVPAFPAKNLWPALRYRTPILPSTAIVKRSALLAIGGFQKLYCIDDWNLWFRLVARYSSDSFMEISERLTLYRWWENNESKNFMPVMEAVLKQTNDLFLSDLTGVRKFVWKRQIEAKQFYNVSLALRELKDRRYLTYAMRSFIRWPLYGRVVSRDRYAVLAHMLVNWPKKKSEAVPRIRTTENTA